ncbi:MAG: response regulator transcription factor [Lachnospiraceae bacterium]|nr:response regulator transcription factor [Lachnospiraceae bacterium]
MPQEILLLEDDDSLNHSVSLKLKKEGYTVHSAFSIEEAAKLFQTFSISLVLCDITLPDGSGLEFCSRIRKESNVLFLFLTALDTEEDMMLGYAHGADDYIAKPFSLSVLVSKVNAMLKRLPSENPKSLVSGNIILYPEENRVTKNGALLTLTAREYSLLAFFMENPMRILSRNQLLEAIWDINGNYVDENTLSVSIRRLREKIEDDPSAPAILKNVRGLGYIWERKCEKR